MVDGNASIVNVDEIEVDVTGSGIGPESGLVGGVHEKAAFDVM